MKLKRLSRADIILLDKVFPDNGDEYLYADAALAEIERLEGLLDEVEASLSMAPHKDSKMATIGFKRLLNWQRSILAKRTPASREKGERDG